MAMAMKTWEACAQELKRAWQNRPIGLAGYASKRVPIPRRMKLDRLNDLIRDGYGQGRNSDYCPWIRIRRRLTSRLSNLILLSTPLYESRPLHLLSGYEDRAANLALWLGVAEIREQFPAWPDPHAHPIIGLCPDRDRLMSHVPGLREIARECGIDHGVYPTTNVPFVATVDLALRVGEPPHDRLVLWSCKPLAMMLKPDARRRLERLELERRYALAIGARNIIFDGTEAPRKFFAQLDWFRPLHDEAWLFGQSPVLEDFAGSFLRASETLPIAAAVRQMAARFNFDFDLAGRLFRLASWTGHIDLDFMQPIAMSRPIRRDGGATRTRLRMALLGGEA
jgi:hypothetical protein